MTDDPRIDQRAVDRPTIVACPHCGKDVETPREEPWLVHGTGRYIRKLVSFRCPRCEHEIRVDE